MDALIDVSSGPDWARTLKVSAGLEDEVRANRQLRTAPAHPVSRVYTGVLYDALDLASLTGAAKARASRSLVVISALFGALRLGDRIPAYRLSMGVRLPGVGALAAGWRGVLDDVLTNAAGAGAIIDARSSTYAAAWTPPHDGDLARRWVTVDVPGATHHAKHTRGLVARALCQTRGAVRTPEQVATAVGDSFDVELVEPTRRSGPWSLRVQQP